MKRLLATLTIAALAFAAGACSDSDKDASNDPVTTDFKVRSRGGNVMTTLPTSDYIADIPADAAWVEPSGQSAAEIAVFSVAPNDTGAERSTTISFREATTLRPLAYMRIQQAADSDLQSGDFVIEEIFYTFNVLPETGKQGDGSDQYIKIRNNTDRDLYADGLMIIDSKLNSGQNFGFAEGSDPRPDYCIAADVFCIPGNGGDVLVKAGQTLLICNQAQNHKATNTNSFDLTKADFEWFVESTNENFLDIDNPAVPNLDVWYVNSLTLFVLHTRGYNCIALAMPPAGMTKEKFLADYAAEVPYIFHSPNGKDYNMTLKNCYKVPNAWVLDAVNTGIPSTYISGPWHSSLDAGYTYCHETDSDASAHGMSVRRKAGSNGKLVDTNNSTNDFTPRSTPSLKAGE